MKDILLIIGLLAIEALMFALGALVHAGYLVEGYEHSGAVQGEAVVVAVLLLGAVAAYLRPRRARQVALAVQVFALFVTLMGATLIAIGIGPRTVLDYSYHASLAVVICIGIHLVRQRVPPAQLAAAAPSVSRISRR